MLYIHLEIRAKFKNKKNSFCTQTHLNKNLLVKKNFKTKNVFLATILAAAWSVGDALWARGRAAVPWVASSISSALSAPSGTVCYR